MKLFVLLILSVFASDKKENDANDPKNGEKIGNNEDNSIFVKIEEDEYVKVSKKYKFIGVTYHKNNSNWRVQRWGKNENKNFYNGCYSDEEVAAHASDTLARKLMGNGEQNHKLNFPDDHTEFYPEKSSKYIGVSYNKNTSKWSVQRWSKNENKKFNNGYYDDEELAAHASDCLARNLMDNGEQNHKLNFPDDHFEVYPEKSSKYIGVSYNKNNSKWSAQRWSKYDHKFFTSESYGDEETAAHASDTLARNLMDNGEKGHKLNFSDDYIEFYTEEKCSKYIGVTYDKETSKWSARRWGKNGRKLFHNGCYDDEKTTAHASDTLARKLMKNGEQGLKLNFPDNHIEVYAEEKTTSSKYIGVSYNKSKSKWCARRWSKNENKTFYNGYYDVEETAARASDTLARKLLDNGEQSHKLNFPDDHTEFYPKENQNKKRKRSKSLDSGPQNN